MPNNRCNKKIVLKKRASNVYFLSEFDELIDKSIIFFKELGFKVVFSKGILILDVKNTREFFSDNIDVFNATFNDSQRDDIKVFIEYLGDSPFSYQSILLAKPLQKYINILEDKEFFDIINHKSLKSYFQPIINMHDNTIYGYQTVIFGVKEDGTLMSPDILFEKSKQNDLIFKLGRLCRETALKSAASKKITEKVFINFIPMAIYKPEFYFALAKKWAKINPSQIVFEVVESNSEKHQKHLKRILNYYRDKGYNIALDNVGEGYSSLNMLIDFKPDIIRIDGNVIDRIDQSEFQQSVYKALYTIAQENNIKVLAEGVKTVDELEMIKSIGVDYVQGDYFSKLTSEPIREIREIKKLRMQRA
ncbi:MAG: EAL domain-containing protein [Candidatus Marinarcus sp.]|uniref:EAL domain-containing protein n=1 Tax=Candidatus Marinarcus sp. TaxID=3100987 RepID=UPI003AFFF51C